MGTFAFPEGLAPEVYPLAWLVGAWEGTGTIGYPSIEERAMRQRVVFTSDGGPYLAYSSTVWAYPPASAAPSDGRASADAGAGSGDGSDPEAPEPDLWHQESGYWRAVSTPAPDRPTEIEALLADPAGFVTVYLGQVSGPRVDLASDLVARTASGAQIEAASRMYGLVESDLLWVWDIAAFGHPLGSYMAARLVRQP